MLSINAADRPRTLVGRNINPLLLSAMRRSAKIWILI